MSAALRICLRVGLPWWPVGVGDLGIRGGLEGFLDDLYVLRFEMDHEHLRRAIHKTEISNWEQEPQAQNVFGCLE